MNTLSTGNTPSNPVSTLSRRKLVNWFVASSFGALILSIIYPVLRYLTPPRIAEPSANEVEAGTTTDIDFRDKAFKIVRFGADPVIVVRSGEEQFLAFSATCTHLDCIVGFQKEHNRIWCNCHGGAYDLTGRNVAGPPPKPLTPYKVHLIEQPSGPATIVVSKV
ncbi:MAG: ubiquinol-cytochrome c reductase iron-sulfur subunit [Thermoanaerobaculia bacterium]|nr:ubiquinol-cytochrome c reductase iron-sulfur subunit [Thermoanaerobaculia bacterium]